LLVPYADFNLLKFPDKARAMEKITDLTMLSDILPTGFHGALTAGVGWLDRVHCRRGPVGAGGSSQRADSGAAVIIIGDRIAERLAHAKKVGFETVDISKHDKLASKVAEILGEPVVDAAVDAVGLRPAARGQGRGGAGRVLNES